LREYVTDSTSMAMGIVILMCFGGAVAVPTFWGMLETSLNQIKVVKHIEMPKAAPQKSICHFHKLEMILK